MVAFIACPPPERVLAWSGASWRPKVPSVCFHGAGAAAAASSLATRLVVGGPTVGAGVPFVVHRAAWGTAAAAAAAVGTLVARRSSRRHARRLPGGVSNAARPLPVRSAGAGVDAGDSAVVPSPDTDSAIFKALREDFPALHQEARPGVPLVYLDSAATSQKPLSVLRALDDFYRHDNSNVHRGMHTLSIRATEAFEGARSKVAKFINAADPCEVVFTRNATEAINLVARTWARANLRPGDEILLTVMEHHSNLVPWQMLAQDLGCLLRFAGLTAEGTLDFAALPGLLTERTRLVSICHVSNVLGCANSIEKVAAGCRTVGAKLLVDACQSVPHAPVDVQALGADWLVASGHKMCGPSGTGFLWGRAGLLREAPPFLGGGEMIEAVGLESSTWADIPHKFEAGTPAFAEAVALGAACEYLSAIGMDRVRRREHELTQRLWARLAEVPGITMYGPSPEQDPQRAALCAFNVKGVQANDIATLVDQAAGVAMRAGHHCAQPLHSALGVESSARLSAYFYNTDEEIDVAVAAVKSAVEFLREYG